MRVTLAGGPKHGAIYEIRDYSPLVFAVNFPVSQLFTVTRPPKPQKPAWWQPWKLLEHKKKLKEWNKWVPPDYTEPTFEQIVYRLKWRNSEGEAIYWYEGTATAPFDTANEIFHYLWARRAEAMNAHHGMLNNHHWEMGRDWLHAIWRAVLSGPPIIQEGDMLVGMPVEVKGLTGAPRIVENERIEAI